MASAGSKRARSAWEDCDDVQELKDLLNKQQDQIEKLAKEKKELRQLLKTAGRQPSEQSPEDLKTQASQILRSLSSNISAQMVYRNKHSNSKVSAEAPNVTFPQLKAMLGSEIADKASNGPKKFEVTVDGDALSNLTGSEFSKSLRYGATLELNKGLKFSYDKAAQHLKVFGTYSMQK